MYDSNSSNNRHNLEDMPIDYELAKDLTALSIPDSCLDYDMKLRKMELINPSLREEIVEYKIGVDFMTNKPIYKYKNNSINYNSEEVQKTFEALQDLDASIRVIEGFPEESFF